MPTSKSSRSWLKEHFSDYYVKKAQQEGYRSRAIYKLQEIDIRDNLFKPGMTIIDLGAAPGSWSQWLIKRVGKKGRVIALDILPIEPILGVESIQGDFTIESVLLNMTTRLAGKKVDWVVSDMAPNMSGIESVDQTRSMYLAELAFDFAKEVLSEQGGLLVKAFQGSGFDEFLTTVRQYFKKVVIRKPKASRDRSNEVYLLAKT